MRMAVAPPAVPLPVYLTMIALLHLAVGLVNVELNATRIEIVQGMMCVGMGTVGPNARSMPIAQYRYLH